MDLNEHQSLVNVIKGVHQKLRKAVALSGDHNKVWAEHLNEQDLRKKYSLAMHKLATEIWKGKETRIEWAYQTSLDYFYNGGLERSLRREEKLKKIALKKQHLISSTTEENEDISEQNNYKNLNQKLKLLDVGSCYNPFSKFEEFKCTAIDLTPATKDVLQCDFLSLEIKPKVEENSCSDLCSSLFYEESFDIVILSLVLEYLPACEQRAIFCHKSWQLLQNNGLCIIITPDSKSVNHNVHMMKSWKSALEKIGFVRVKYDKLQHVHCIAFRKLKRDVDHILQCDSISQLFYIPQDFTTCATSENVAERTDEENFHIYHNFSELPNED